MSLVKLHRTTHGIGVTFPANILDQLNLTEGDMLDVTLTSEGVLLTPLKDEDVQVLNVAKRIMDENHAVLRALAESERQDKLR